ncbi:glycoside hydrolase family 3 N-terminal domain-containing protein [Chitinophaga nivalis]|uniref:beta-N-acetylhexosaminidase n=1 Tax=Chitinophaga nivalis TaxID=2991709 RepID=A0ABT3IVI7_9BACT|nr:glycoside hydrolase family 3 N-terminal domain-containing protein [Chitinophaga nivalis]MCW3462329.1 serine hydrolase [Chitinophaga nivalis]MCW3487980.1 serine hydrolase [Chitinophaga nivalis]
MRKQLLVAGLTGLMITGSAFSSPPGSINKKKQKKVTERSTPQQDKAAQWADSVFQSLTPDERIAQLILIRAHSNLGQDHINAVVQDIRQNKVGGVIFFQGGPVRQANLTNYYQSISKVPLMVAIDGEWGLGMRLDSVISLPRNMMIGAVQDTALAYEAGRIIGEQCRRIGIHLDFAPDIDVNNNPNNPVINDRSFGENKYQVARMGVATIRGMQDAGIMACAKHFPGHGDTNVDSHFDLPSINKTREQLDSLELYPFREAIAAGVGSVMIAHLNIPAIDKRPNTPTSISYNAVTKLLKNELGYKGLIVTDALEMKGIAKFYTKGQESLQSLLAGNDLMILPSTSAGSVAAIRKAIKNGKISQEEVDSRVKKVLRAKYDLGLWQPQHIDTNNLTEDINAKTDSLRRRIAEKAITVVRNDKNLIPFSPAMTQQKLAVIAVGADGTNTFVETVKANKPGTDVFLFTSRQSVEQIAPIVSRIQRDYKAVIISLHDFSRRPSNNFGLSMAERLIIRQLQTEMPSATVVFGNPYALQYFCDARNIVAAYEDDSTTQRVAADLLFGKIGASGKLPVTVCPGFPSGSGVTYEVNQYTTLPSATAQEAGVNEASLLRLDGLANDMINRGAAPGCAIVAMKNGRMVYNRCFGHYEYNKEEPVSPQAIYDLASVTKICATTLAVMRLYDEGKLKLDATLGDYLPLVQGTDKAPLKIRDILLHQAGLVPYIPFYKETLYPSSYPDTLLYRPEPDDTHMIRVADRMYMRDTYTDTMWRRILDSRIVPHQGYVYSDLDYIFLGKIVEQLTGKKLNVYVQDAFYTPLGLATTGFLPRTRFDLTRLVPTEREYSFRGQLLRGDVHDPGAAMFGGVAGHAGLFSNAHDLGVIMQMLLNQGSFNGVQYLKPETVKLFTAYNSHISRRGLGFDKPEKDNYARREAYPAKSATAAAFGHTGFTGTCVWADPSSNLVFIFLSNRVYPNGGANTKLSALRTREKMLDVVYESFAN